MENLTVFNNEQFGTIRTAEIDGEPWLAGKDVAVALGYSNPRDAIARHVDAEDRRVSRFATPSGEQEMTVINESGMLSLALSSKLPSAKAFKRWVTSEVLPSIRKTGSYSTPQAVRMSDALAAMANVARLAEDNQRRLNAVEESQKALDSKLDKAAEAFTAPSYSADTWQENARATIAAIVQENGLSYQAYTGELYQRLESAAGVNLKSRQVFKQKRMKAEGARYRERQAVTKLNVIADDAKLRLVFDHILAMEKAKRLMKGGASA